ncbi:hypothetical protein C8R44DRAFT_977429 [Mycena epipterygia]|nr:hypothetical protein C8R44DRAFT_977429 [Mycena epipterygia]
MPPPAVITPHVSVSATLDVWGTQIPEFNPGGPVKAGDRISFKVWQTKGDDDGLKDAGWLFDLKSDRGWMIGRTWDGYAPKGVYEVLDDVGGAIRLKSATNNMLVYNSDHWIWLTDRIDQKIERAHVRFIQRKSSRECSSQQDDCYWMNFESNNPNLVLHFDRDRQINTKYSGWAFGVTLIKDASKEYEAQRSKELQARYESDLQDEFNRVISESVDPPSTDRILGCILTSGVAAYKWPNLKEEVLREKLQVMYDNFREAQRKTDRFDGDDIGKNVRGSIDVKN